MAITSPLKLRLLSFFQTWLRKCVRPGFLIILCSGLAWPADALAATPVDQDYPSARTGWRKQEPIPTPWYFYDVDMVSTTEGWALSHPITGDHANIFHTTNGGQKWTAQGPLFRQLNGVSFVDNLHGVAVGNEYRYTLDGGVTWLAGTTNNFA